MHQSLPSPNLHRHAWSQHQRGQGQSLPIADGQTTLVSTGTGSGKTECFLYPVVSQCLKLRDEKAPPGISAVIVYPMNALAEDQLMRLRGLLAGTGIPFGIYVGKTPERDVDVVGVRLRAGSSRADYEARLDRARRDGSGETVYPAEEVCSREIMRTARRQARILLTNVKQLELLLTRQQDIELFTDDPQAARKFAARFFGVASETVTPVGEDYEAEIWAEPRSVAPEPSEYPAEILERCVGAVQDDDPAGPHVRAAYRSLSGVDLDRDAWPAALHEALSRSEIVFALNEELAAPRALDELPVALQRRIGRPVTEAEILAWLTLGAAEAGPAGFWWPPLEETLGGMRVVLVDHLIGSSDDHGDPADHPRAVPLHFCRRCGAAHPKTVSRCLSCGEAGNSIQLFAIRQNKKNLGHLTSCLSCGATGRRVGGRYREPARPVRAINVADVHMLTQYMVQHAERRKYLRFQVLREVALSARHDARRTLRPMPRLALRRGCGLGPGRPRQLRLAIAGRGILHAPSRRTHGYGSQRGTRTAGESVQGDLRCRELPCLHADS